MICKYAKAVAVSLTVLFAPVNTTAWATAITSAQNGNWSSTSTWTGGVVPGIGDTVTINKAVVVDVNKTVGTSPSDASTNVIAVTSVGSLTVSSSVTLTVRGNVQLNGGTLTLSAGSNFVFENTSAATPASAAYQFSIVAGGAGKIICNGTSVARCAVSITSGGGAAKVVNANVVATYTDWTRFNGILGPATNLSTTNLDFTHCTFNSFSGTVTPSNSTGGLVDGAVYRFEDCVWSGTTATNALALIATLGAANTTGTRSIKRCVFDKAVLLYSPRDFSIEQNYFAVAPTASYTVAQYGKWASFDGNFSVNNQYPNGVVASGDVTNNFLYHTYASGNPHHLTVLVYNDHVAVTGNIFEYSLSDGTGDCILLNSPTTAGPWVCTAKFNLVLPNNNGVTPSDSGTLFSQLGNANSAIICEHNTAFVGTQPAGAVGESYTGYAGMVQSFRSNLLWRSSATTGAYKYGQSGNAAQNSVQDLASSANVDYNSGFNLNTGSLGGGYNNVSFSSGTPGAHDVDGDPQFVDSTRNLRKWSTYRGGDGSAADALARLQADPTLTKSSLLPYIRAGFVPQATAIRNATYPGDSATTDGAGNALNGTIGAMGQSSGTNPFFFWEFILRRHRASVPPKPLILVRRAG